MRRLLQHSKLDADWPQTRSFGDVGFDVRFAQKRTRRAEYTPYCTGKMRRPKPQKSPPAGVEKPDIPVIVITALDLDDKDRERLNSGVQSVLVKETFRPDDLVERIRRLADTRAAVNGGAVSAS